MKTRLVWKLVIVQVPGIIAAIALIWVAIDYLAANYFSSLMERYNVSPRESHQMFLEAVHRYLIVASLLALLLGSLLSYLFTRRALDPLRDMIGVAYAIADGDYSRRVTAASSDEVGQLAAAFNQMADNLEEIEQLRRSLVADVAHELRTPLTNIRGYLEAFREGILSPEQSRLDMLHDEALQLVRLTESMLELARADAAHLAMDVQSVQIRPLIHEVVDSLSSMMERRGMTLHVTVAPEVESVVADGQRLRQILRNLLENAVTYGQEHGEIHVSATRQGRQAKVEIANEGQPVPAEDLPYVFERFFRGEKSRSRSQGGAGIGLAIVKELVTAHGGEVGAEPANRGMRFWFTLPQKGPLGSS